MKQIVMEWPFEKNFLGLYSLWIEWENKEKDHGMEQGSVVRSVLFPKSMGPKRCNILYTNWLTDMVAILYIEQ